MQFGKLVQNNVPITMIQLKSKPDEFQYDGCLFFQTGSRYISDMD